MKPSTDTARPKKQQRLFLSMLPTSHRASAVNAELSPTERKLLEDFRQLSDESRQAMVSVIHTVAIRDSAARAAELSPKLRLLQGGAI